ncbi:hypothetical protein ZHAS_00012885 [Anopheles sinensis]|uniref:Uncharacterized protein n=1 Tax=Anopheles sinensis TaxID=74873 RepID=A0A084W4B5_ANOSI|nr:hypothetical protein ZHAS_00012885 [Anopheles sinensis]
MGCHQSNRTLHGRRAFANNPQTFGFARLVSWGMCDSGVRYKTNPRNRRTITLDRGYLPAGFVAQMSGRHIHHRTTTTTTTTMSLLSGSCTTVTLLTSCLLLLLQVAQGSNGDFSYFYGKIAPTDTLCAKKVVGIGTKTPVQVDYSSTQQRPITAVSLDASNVAYQGFNVFVAGGAIGQQRITFSLTGPWILPYYIELDYYCGQR